MDPIRNPFAPGAGTPPPALVGRDDILSAAEITLHRIRKGRPEKSLMLLGLRGVGKTVLLNKIGERAEEIGYSLVKLEAPEGQRLAQYLAPALKGVLIRLSKLERAKELASQALGALQGFASVFKVSIGEINLEVADPHVADSGNLEIDLPGLLTTVGKAARAAETSVAILVDEVQYLCEEDLRALIVAFHAISQGGLPIVLFGAGLPQVAGLAGDAKSYAERLFDYPTVGPLRSPAAKAAIRQPIQDEGEEIQEQPLTMIVKATGGYPYFLQEWGKHTWRVAEKSPINEHDVEIATAEVTKALDSSFFRVRFDRLTPREQDYLRAMAELGPGPHRSGEIARLLKKKVESLGPLRSGLIKKGMIWSPSHGDTAFTVPLFDEFMKREVPNWEGPT
ncbi:ATP-binding protein [Alkalimonas amylolytica]|uniref:Predicted ATPase, AAA+ ATPase superfamily n=1 Tax=Alkalimonas amylolytica TaxID=152573 RepID=A0A1H4FVQ4_ALKAM|nr:ATP-binding protein [Alkalimonas amylolytica]SEB01221.1 Predicted ATPase, AAA+ ATPase superfamily [Alkalimonas amylolytica]